MRLLPDTIAGRTIAVLLAGLALFHLASIWVYRIGINSEVDLTNEARLAERLFTIKRAIAGLPAGEREQTAHSLSGGPLEVHWSKVQLTVDTTAIDNRVSGLRQRLVALAPEIGASGLMIGEQSALEGGRADPHLLLVSMKLQDGSWVNFSIAKLTGHRGSLLATILLTSLMALVVIGVSTGMLRSVTRPLRVCAAAAQRLFVDAEPRAIAVSGPREVRELATAFNELQRRVKRLVDDRTLTLAAISHDLKTPLTRIQLRVEEIEDQQLRQNVSSDLAEMLAMIESALDFLKGDQSGEPFQSVDLGAILASLSDDMADTGREIQLQTSPKLILRGRHLALKRAFANLITNATKFATHVQVEAALNGNLIEVTIDDDGPGIPADKHEAVFAPFFRLESSRNRETGGTGLGLTVARTIVRAHGGDISLGNAVLGGLRVAVHLPVAPPTNDTAKQNVTGRKFA